MLSKTLFIDIYYMKGYIYKITNPNGRIYIGQTTRLLDRQNKYKNKHCKSQPALYNSITKYGWDTHIFEVIDETSYLGFNNFLIDLFEIYWIKEYDSFHNGLNCTEGGKSGQYGTKRTEETKKKMSESKIGKKHSEETRKIFSIAQTGRKHSEETKKKISENQLGDKNHRFGKNTPHSEETKIKIGKGREGKLHSDESKRKMSETKKINNKGKILNTSHKKKVEVYRYTDDSYVGTYNSFKECQDELNIYSICNFLTGKQKQIKVYTFKLVM